MRKKSDNFLAKEFLMKRAFLSLVFLLASTPLSIGEEGTKMRASITVLNSVNEIREKRGLKPIKMDRVLMERAQKTSMIRAKRGVSGHLRGWQGLHAKSEGCGARTGKDLEGRKFISCCLYEKWTHGGVGCAYFKGRTYYTLLVR